MRIPLYLIYFEFSRLFTVRKLDEASYMFYTILKKACLAPERIPVVQLLQKKLGILLKRKDLSLSNDSEYFKRTGILAWAMTYVLINRQEIST